MSLLVRSSIGLLLLLAACTSESQSKDNTSTTTGTARSAVQGGKIALTQTFSVGVYGTGLCTGTLIAPNLVITARHCVETEPSSTESGCEEGELLDATQLKITTAAEFGQQGPWRDAVRVLAAPKVDGCSPDMALIQIGKNVPASEATPAGPAVDKAYTTRAHFSAQVTAIGYGLDDQGEAGQRRIRENIPVLCVPGDSEFECGAQIDGYVKDFEFVADKGACQGDSGGGLYDQDSMDKSAPVVVGVVSRGPVENGICGPGAYVRVDKFADFVITAGRVAAKEGGYPVPAWASDGTDAPIKTPDTTGDPEPTPEPAPAPEAPRSVTTTTTGCSASPASAPPASGGNGSGSAFIALGVAIAALRARRRSRTS
jgi:hypothetical protein